MRSYLLGMGAGFRFAVLVSVVSSAFLLSGARAQGLGALEEEESFYTNYATDNYSKEILEERLDDFYDLFGNYITNGYFVYSLSNDRQFVTNEAVSDSTVMSLSNEHRDEIFFQSFSNLCVSRDAVGGIKSTFLIGDQIRTRFAPLTFNKRNYEGIRWDLFYEGLSLTTLISRTRPGLMARSYEGGMGFSEDTKIRDSWVQYPLFGVDLTNNNIDEPWNSSEESLVDFTARSAYGDYDFLWAFYAHKRIMDKVDVGLSYVNHHHSDVSKGEKWHGDIPDALAPDEIHFEFYDQTPMDTDDPGVKLHSITMTVTTEQGVYGPFLPHAFIEDDFVMDKLKREHILLENEVTGAEFPYIKDGTFPAICTFYPKEITDSLGGDSSRIVDIAFDISISGNYIGFVSTDKIAVMNLQHWSNLSGTVQQKQIRDIVTDPADAGTDGYANGMYEPGASEVYLGDYIIRSEGVTGSDNGNHASFTYHYRIPTARVTYGVDVSGELFGVQFDGELALNMKNEKFPARKADVAGNFNLATYLNARYPVKPGLELRGSIFNMAPDYQPYLGAYPFSRTLSIAQRPTTGDQGTSQTGDYPFILSNQYSVIDDNEDDDYYVDAGRRRYPSEMAKNSGGGYYDEGTYKSPTWLRLPGYADSTFRMVYDDKNGVISDRYDRNRNGVFDYEEDFLLYSADPPRYDLEQDLNGNGIPDTQEDDIYPDYPVKPVYMYTSNGYRSMGVRGLNLEMQFTRGALSAVVSGEYRTALERGILNDNVADLDVGNAASSDEGRSLQGGGRLMYRYSRRDIGVNIFAGQELKYIRDGIRDDVVMSALDDSKNLFYYVMTDAMHYRNALVSRTAVSLNYLNIPKLDLTAKAALDLEQHLAVDDRMNRAFTYWHEDYDRYEYLNVTDTSPQSTVMAFSGVLKLGYTFELGADVLPAGLKALDGLKIIPQYKLMYDHAVSSDGNPREDAYNRALELEYDSEDSVKNVAFAQDWKRALAQWHTYRAFNKADLLSVPMLRALYPLGNRTTLELGWQLKRSADMLVPEESYIRQSRVAQLVINDNYMSFDLSVVMGLVWEDTDYAVNHFIRMYQLGHNWDNRRSEAFCKIYMGI